MKYFKLMLWKTYFDEGMGLLNYLTKVLLVLGVAAAFSSYPGLHLFIIGVGYGIFAFVLGRWWYVSGMKKAHVEVQNLVNPFVHEMRERFK